MLHSKRRKISQKERERGEGGDQKRRERKFHDRSWSIAEIARKWESAATMFPNALGSKRVDRPAIFDVEKRKTGQKATVANGVDKTH